MKVYLLTYVYWDSFKILGVFSTEQKALAHKKQITEYNHTHLYIEEYTLDEGFSQ